MYNTQKIKETTLYNIKHLNKEKKKKLFLFNFINKNMKYTSFKNN